MRITLDLNSPEFQSYWFALSKNDQVAVLATLRKLCQLTWEDLYRDKGLRWEVIHTKAAPDGSRLYSLRITRKTRATAQRSGDILKLLTLHADHDSAYQ